jgi:hypothetical protein
MDAKLLRAVLTHTQDHPELLDLTTYGQEGPRGIAADIAGRALLLSGRWELAGNSTFKSADDGREVSGWQAVEHEARTVLGLTEDEEWGHGDITPLFSITSRDEATGRLRELTEEAEAVTANA